MIDHNLFYLQNDCASLIPHRVGIYKKYRQQNS
jgi:hypothetical protein